jgi:hypothetical protein
MQRRSCRIKVDYWCYLDEVESSILAAENGK